jgi:DNA-binding beta-propeller fold protein YncE
MGYTDPNDNIPANTATLYSPRDVTVDASTGDLYIADTNNHRVRMVAKATGLISTIAGVGVGGYFATDDGAQAVLALLNAPSGVVVDCARRQLYIADQANHRIRCVDLVTKIITTVAGTGVKGYSKAEDGHNAISARLNNPSNLALDPVRNLLFVSDRDNKLVSMVSFNTSVHTIMTIAGGGTVLGDGGAATSAQIKSPRGLAYSPNDNALYIADYSSNRIRKVILNTGIISTVAGTGVASYSGDGGLATSATLIRPWGVAVDADQYRAAIFISDSSNAVIRRVDGYTGFITTIAGINTPDYGGDMGLAIEASLSGNSGMFVDNDGMIYIADSDNNRIRKVITMPISPTPVPTPAPTLAGSLPPTAKPTPRAPTLPPTPKPSSVPTLPPTPRPTSEPTGQPSKQPSLQPKSWTTRVTQRR